MEVSTVENEKFKLNESTGVILFVEQGCEYNPKTKNVIHESGPFTEETCKHGYGSKPVEEIPSELIQKSHEIYQKLNSKATEINQKLLELVKQHENGDSDLFPDGECDISEYEAYLKDLKLPNEYYKKKYNIIKYKRKDEDKYHTVLTFGKSFNDYMDSSDYEEQYAKYPF